jgi:hypothetical protein
MKARTITTFSVLALASCSGGTTGPDSGSPPVTTPVSDAPTSAPAVRATVGLAAMVEAALDAAALKTGLARSALEVVSSEAVVWPDGSLGCGVPGMNYTMAPVPGYRIAIRAGGDVLDYHASEWGQLVLCPPGRSAAPSPIGTT